MGATISEQGSKLSDMTGITTQTTNEVGWGRGARPGVLKNGKFKRTSLKNIQMLPQYVSHERRWPAEKRLATHLDHLLPGHVKVVHIHPLQEKKICINHIHKKNIDEYTEI